MPPAFLPTPPGLPQVSSGRQQPAPGFTQIELILVIVVLGVLAAMALPRLADIGREARIAAVQGLAAAAAAELAMVKAMCATSVDTCDVASAYNPASGAPPTVVLDGVIHRLQYGYFWADTTGQGGGLPARLSFNGFDIVSDTPSGTGTQFRLSAAPDPANCLYRYLGAWAVGADYTATVTTSGC